MIRAQTPFRPGRLFGLSAIFALILTVFAVGTIAPAFAREDPAVRFMRQAANELITAQQTGTASAFQRVIRRYGFIAAISRDSLGSYGNSARLSRAQRGDFQKGLIRFLARYAANESPKYPVARVEFDGAGIRDGRHVLVDSTIVLKDGSRYSVRWMLAQSGKSFRVRDVQVLGFVWAVQLLAGQFESWISNQGNGRVETLIAAVTNFR